MQKKKHDERVLFIVGESVSHAVIYNTIIIGAGSWLSNINQWEVFFVADAEVCVVYQSGVQKRNTDTKASVALLCGQVTGVVVRHNAVAGAIC